MLTKLPARQRTAQKIAKIMSHG